MLRHIVIRILMIIPTLVVMSIVVFLLSTATPNDYVENMLSLEGVTKDDDRIDYQNYNKLYHRKAKELYKDLPLFYISVTPHNYPNINNISKIPLVEKGHFINLLKHHISKDDAYVYLDAIKQFRQFVRINKDSIDVVTRKDLSQLSALLAQPENLVEIRKSTLNLAYKYQDSDLVHGITNLIVNIPTDNNDYVFHLPTLTWNGFGNQYHKWIVNFLGGNFGSSVLDAQPVSKKISAAIKWTILLVFFNVLLSLIISIPLSLISAYKANTWIDTLISWTSITLYSIPLFWLATLLIIYFTTDTYGSWLDIFSSPSSFYYDKDTSLFSLIGKYISRLILPVICLTILDIAYITRILRADLLKEFNKSYAITLKAKGIESWTVLWKHILPNSLISLTTLLINNIPIALAGTMIIEVIFNIPGMGRLMYSSIYAADWNVVYTILLLIALLTVLFYLLGDIIYAILNPRISYGEV